MGIGASNGEKTLFFSFSITEYGNNDVIYFFPFKNQMISLYVKIVQNGKWLFVKKTKVSLFKKMWNPRHCTSGPETIHSAVEITV